MKLTWFREKENCLYINSNAISKHCGSIKANIEYMRRPIEDRIAESRYRAEIEAELAKHPGCKISEFIEGPTF